MVTDMRTEDPTVVADPDATRVAGEEPTVVADSDATRVAGEDPTVVRRDDDDTRPLFWRRDE
jgi:hypothetical protein